MSELRNRTLAPPPPRHPTANPYGRSGALNVPPPPVHPSHPSLPPRPPPSPRPDARSEYFSNESIHSQVAAPLDTPYMAQGPPPPVPPNRPANPQSFSENVVASTSSLDLNSVGTPNPPPEHPSISPELLPPVSRASPVSSITGSPVVAPPPPPVHHARKEHSLADPADEDTLSEKELRDLYNDEEIDRFLRLFSAVGCSNLRCTAHVPTHLHSM